MRFYAKSKPVQSIKEHTQELLNKLAELKARYPDVLSEREWEMLYIICLYHDMGKIDRKFQNTIRQAIKERLLQDPHADWDTYPHNYLSGAFLNEQALEKKFEPAEIEIIYKAIYYHHSRQELSLEDISNLNEYVEKVLPDYAAEFHWDLIEQPERFLADYLYYSPIPSFSRLDDDMILRYQLIKGLLNRLDYAASAGLPELEIPVRNARGFTAAELAKNHITDQGYDLRPVQVYMQKHQADNLIVTAATGIGKTEAALLWLGKAKGFYTLPVKVSINAIYERIKKSGYEPVHLLHSDAFSFYLKEGEEDAHLKYTASRLLASPLTICTVDQLFQFVYKFNGGEMPLATLAYSKLIIDEIQMYSSDIIAALIYGLKTITDLGGKFAIITATFPPVLSELFCKYKIPVKAPENIYHGPISQRHRIKLWPGEEFPFEQILTQAEHKKILILCNTVGRAQSVYRSLQEATQSVRLLHGAFLKKDRAILEADILQFAPNHGASANDQTGIWVSTQIVEASLDLDFDLLYTEMCTIDSLLQRMGRVYRSRCYDLGEEPNVYIINNHKGYGGVVDAELYDFSLIAVKAYDGFILEESDSCDYKQSMVEKVYDPQCNPGILRSDYFKQIKQKIQELKQLSMYDLDKKEARGKFRDIDSITVVPEKIYQELKQAGQIEKWGKSLQTPDIPFEHKQRMKDEIAEYTVSLSYYHRLDIEFGQEKFYPGSRIYLYKGDYDFDGSKGVGLIRQYKKKQQLDFDSFW